MGISPAGVRDGGGMNTGGGDLHLPPLEQGCTVYFYQDHYGPFYGGVEETGSKGVQWGVGTGRGGYGGDADSRLGQGTDGGGGGDIWYVDRYRLSWWEDNVENFNLGTEPNSPLVYATVLEHQHPIISTPGDPRENL